MLYKFEDDEINYMLSLLAERPYRESASLIKNIHEQYDKQIKTDDKTI